VAKRDEAPVALHPADLPAWREVHSGGDPDIDMEDGGVFEVADVTLEVLHSPGHSRGSCCLYSEELDAVFTGDVVTENGPVPHEDGFPNWAKQLDAIGANILTLPSSTRILPGHGDEFTVASADKRFNSWAAAGQDLASLSDSFGSSDSSDEDPTE
jgi:glyoxylase-like metal-dependent hydrolase (beta-lactamase superfamily II)